MEGVFGGDGGVTDVGVPEVDGGVVAGFLGWLGHGGCASLMCVEWGF